MTPQTETIHTAVALASSNASKATEIANTAVKVASDLAAKTAESNAVISTNMEWIKKSLTSIEVKLEQIDKAFVTAVQHSEVVKNIADHEIRINNLETEKTRTTTLITVAGAILTLLIGLLIWHLFQQGV